MSPDLLSPASHLQQKLRTAPSCVTGARAARPTVRANLALVLYGNRRAAEARAVAAPVCGLGDTAYSKPVRAPLKNIGICE
jgi:hypothetical protein